MQDTRIGFIGAGNMASSIIGGLINRGHAASLISASDLDTEKLGALAARTGLSAADNETIARTADVIVLAVKPQVMSAVCTALASSLEERRPLIVLDCRRHYPRGARALVWLGCGARSLHA